VTIVLIFLTAVILVIGWWLHQQGITSKPWLQQGVLIDGAPEPSIRKSHARMGLGVFLTVVGCLFALLFSAYALRSQMGDWRAPPTPRLLWLNTGVLVWSSLALQTAHMAEREHAINWARIYLVLAGIAAAVFLAAQVLLLRQLASAGYFLTSNPANSFLYLITGLHGLHLLGGLVALTMVGERFWSTPVTPKAWMSLGLCATYWHVLLVIWLLFAALLTGWADEFVAFCRQLT
jgi:cytochrome c oxidase subunit 3